MYVLVLCLLADLIVCVGLFLVGECLLVWLFAWLLACLSGCLSVRLLVGSLVCVRVVLFVRSSVGLCVC